MTTITENVDLPTGANPRHVVVHVFLAGQDGAPLPAGYATVDGVTIVGRYSVPLDADGSWSVELVPNADITPAGTVWGVILSGPRPEHVSTVARFGTVPASGTFTFESILTDPPGALTPSALAAHQALIGVPSGHLPAGDPDDGDVPIWNELAGTASWGPQTGGGSLTPPITLPGDVREGSGTTASGTDSHAEGTSTTASGDDAHAEGGNTSASGIASHAEGEATQANGVASHAEGSNTIANGQDSHAEGSSSFAAGVFSHAEGDQSAAIGQASHAEGSHGFAYAKNMHAHGFGSGNFQYARVGASAGTPDDTPTPLVPSDDSGHTLQLQAFAGLGAIVQTRVVARNIDGTATSAWEFPATVISGDGVGVYRWVGGSPPVAALIVQDVVAAAWGVTMDIGPDDQSLIITATGAAADVVFWEATIELDEVGTFA